jgi:hypothetical protein
MPVPTREAFAATAEKARQAGRQAAWKIYEDLRSQGYDSPPNLLGGFVYLHFLIDGRSKLARFFRSIEKDPLPNIKVSLGYRGSVYIHITFYDYEEIKGWVQSSLMAQIAYTEASKVFKQLLGIQGTLHWSD